MSSEADLVVVGYGAAGAAAAITAADLGASVVVLEKQRADRHTPSSRMSGGIVMACDDVEDATAYLDACSGGMIPTVVTRAWAERMAGLLDWFPRVGIDLPLQRCGGAEHPDRRGAGAIGTYQPGRPAGAGQERRGAGDAPGQGRRLDPGGGAGRALWAAVAAAVEARPVDVRWETPARRLRRDTTGVVTGVEVMTPGGDTQVVGARRGVVLACGGFEFDPWLKRNHLRTDPVHFYGNPGNTGDGIRMAQEVGAELWHMNQMVGRAVAWFPDDEGGGGLGFIVGLDPGVGDRTSVDGPGYVIVDRYGQRFANEESQARLRHDFYYELLAFDAERGEYPRNPCYWIFDERRRRAGPLTYAHIGAAAVGLHDWSPDNSAEIERGWIARGATPGEAAAAAGCADPEAAGRTVHDYNAGCAAARDPFSRPPTTLAPLDAPPYYCVPLWAGGSNTSGGPRRDECARVLGPRGAPVPGLYGAGELGQALGLLYPGDGGNLSDAFCFGQIAAETALA